MRGSDKNRTVGPEALSRRQVLFGQRRADNDAKAVAQVGSGCLMAKGVACRLCEDSCEAGAFRFQPLIGGRTEVRVDEARCTGCADCVDRCPVSAISISGKTRTAQFEGAGRG